MSDLSPSQVNSRVKILERPFISPGKCIMCGAVDRPVVDFGANIRNYGAVMFCTTCIAEIGSAVGLVPESQLIDNERAVGVIVKDYLSSHNLTVVKNDYLDVIDNALSNVASARVYAEYILPVEDSEKPATDDLKYSTSEPPQRSVSDRSTTRSKRTSRNTTSDSDKSPVVEGSSGLSDSGSIPDIPDLS